ncbi:YigZ family protein [Vibrio lentus]|uniref:YigZ family protein n=1 Tax=Vibrio lentus TaxID=136468 RepID=A0AB36XIQ2_9VIBR|nr:YigZ family protein [Vibrio lentus]MCC4840219.1 YigZ family protein [Vibrio lentus]PMI12684.1 YigZ family protein [Vibrio lentus]PMK32309.1 YigZ family protein [Vibrio lentus]PMK44839.1 YigZ family protein [Vibrio lentus]PML30536.1 YigZ family protein [Vibrio lentus]
MNEQPYLIPSSSALFEEEIKKSVFITHLAHTPNVEAAKQFVEQVKKEHSSARHNCWGFAAGRPEDSMQWGFSDDGEPSGTAGKPILAQLSGSGVGELTAVVTRYSGGIKLGTGGLVKAYGGGVQQALKLLQTIEKKITTKLRLELDYGFVPIAQSIMAQHQAVEVQADYGVQVELIIEIELLQVDSFTQTMINKSGAKALVTKVKDN